MRAKWLIVAVTGPTCSGKTTIAKKLEQILEPHVHVMHQDDYFHDVTYPGHVIVPELNHINFDLLTSLNMAQMERDIRDILNDCELKLSICAKKSFPITTLLERTNTRILLLEGFSLLSYAPINNMCHVKCYLDVDRETCRLRRLTRVYDPPDVPGYFDMVVWPQHLINTRLLFDDKDVLVVKDTNQDVQVDVILTEIGRLLA